MPVVQGKVCCMSPSYRTGYRLYLLGLGSGQPQYPIGCLLCGVRFGRFSGEDVSGMSWFTVNNAVIAQ